MREPSDVLYSEILKLNCLTNLLMSNDKTMEIDTDGLASILQPIVEELKNVHSEINMNR